MAAFGGDDALGAMMAATLPRSTMSKDQMQSIANGARPKTARPKTARPKKETKPWTKEDVTKLKKACKDPLKDKLLDKFIHTENNAAKVENLSRILNKKWSEETNSYMLLSQIDRDREVRIKSVLGQGRYEPGLED